jgi:menaquinone-dependent protoporphyrinogen oxidase
VTSILAVYGTAYGQTERVVRRLAERLGERGLTVTSYRGDALPTDLDVDRFDGVLVAASVIRGRHQAYMREFVRRHVARLNAAPSAFVSVSGAAGSPRPDKQAEAQEYLDGFLRQTGWRPTLTALVGGTLAYTKYGFLLRWLIKRIAKQGGGPTDTTRDHDTADWDAVDRFALRIVEALAQPARA